MKRFQIVVECEELPEWIYDSVLTNAPVNGLKVIKYDEFLKPLYPSREAYLEAAIADEE